jgi:hypothetical protein
MTEDPKSLSYDRTPPPGIPRWQFRLLFGFVLLNLAITIQSSYAPGVAAALKQRWAKYQDERQARALYQQVSTFAEPAGKVVWDENPDTAAKLLGTPGYAGTRTVGVERYPLLAGWPKGARATASVEVDAFHRRHFTNPFPNLSGRRSILSTDLAPILVHRLKTPAGEDRLVYVYVEGNANVSSLRVDGRPYDGAADAPLDRAWTATAEKSLSLVAVPCHVEMGGTRVTAAEVEKTSLRIYRGAPLRFTWSPPAGDGRAQIRLDPKGLFRFYAGQPDRADPSRFTFDYEVDGQRGTVRGRLLADGTVELLPNTGTTVGGQWFPDGAVPGSPMLGGTNVPATGPAAAQEVFERMRRRRVQGGENSGR